MDTTLTAAAIATIISAITSASITLYINNSNKKKNIDDQLDTLLKLAIQYPYLESSKLEKITEIWSNDFRVPQELIDYEYLMKVRA